MTDMDVLAGIIGSDGHLAKSGYSVYIINKDLEFLESIGIPLMKEHSGKQPSVSFIPSGFGTGKNIVRVASKELWKRMIEQYGIPAGAKSYTIKPPNLPSLENNKDYLRGWIAGDGSVTHDRMRVKLEIWSKSEGMMLWFKGVFKELGIETALFKEKNKNEHILRVGKKEEMLKFYKEITIPHPEKQRRLDSLIQRWIS